MMSGFREWLRQHYKSAVIKLAVVIFVVLSNAMGESWVPWQRGEMFSFVFLRRLLTGVESPAVSPVVMIDIGELQSTREMIFTDLLTRVIRNVAASDPAAIGVDVDFSPQEEANEGNISLLLRTCESLHHETDPNARIPVFLGVYKTAAREPDQWLMLPGHREVGAFIGLAEDDIRKIPRRITSRAYGNASLPSMAQALAESYVSYRGRDGRLPGPDRYRFCLESEEVKLGDPQKKGARTSLVSGRMTAQTTGNETYTYVQSFIPFKDIDNIPIGYADMACKINSATSLKGKMVLIGYATSEDHFAEPDQKHPNRGIKFHASAAASFARYPVFELRRWVRWVIDLISSLVLVGLSLWGQYRAFIRRPLAATGDDNSSAWSTAVILPALFLVLFVIGAVGLAVTLNVLWLDVAAASVGLAIGVLLERGIEHAVDRIAPGESPPVSSPQETAPQNHPA